jgi:hypothetical protein
MKEYQNIDPFSEEDWEETESVSTRDIYDVIYGALVTYYTPYFVNYRMVEYNNKLEVHDQVQLFEIDRDGNEKFLCNFVIKGDKIETIYEIGNKRHFSSFKIENLNDDKWRVFKTFRFIFDEYLKENKNKKL